MLDSGLAQQAVYLLDAGHDVEVLDLHTLDTGERLAPPADPTAALDQLAASACIEAVHR